ncbi:MAG: TonB-dependent receptor plug domain-containing protein, partial [bacterium]
MSLESVVTQLQRRGYSIVYSSEVASLAKGLSLESISLDSLRKALPALGLTLKPVGEIWVVTFESEQLPEGESVRRGDDSDESPNPHIENIIVTGSQYRFPTLADNAGTFSMTAEEIQATPALGSDAIRIVNRLPGTSSVGVSAKPRIRGGSQDEVLILMDGVELLEPFHLSGFHQGYSSIDSRAIDTLEVNTGGFHARYGNRMSGVMAIDTDGDIPEYPNELGLSSFARFVNTTGQLDSPLEPRWKLTFREGELEKLTDFLEPRAGSPEYSDGQFRLGFTLKENTDIAVGSFVSLDDNRFQDDEESASSKADSYYYWGKLDTT